MDNSYKICLAIGSDASRNVITEMLKGLAHDVRLVTRSGRELIAAVEESPPELLIASVQLSDMDGIEALIECGRKDPLPSIIISTETDQDKVERALQDHVMAYLAEPVTANDLRPAIFLVMQRFAQFQELREENEELRHALETRKWVERAKGLLMQRFDLNEEEAYKRLQRTASDRRCKIGQISRTLVEAGDILDDLKLE